MRAAGLALALLALVTSALAYSRVVPRTELVYRTAESGDWRSAIEARASGVPSRVSGEGDTWSVIVRTEDVVSTERSLDWDGTLALYAPCAATSDVQPDTSAAVRAIVESEAEGPRVRLYEATSVESARTRCVEMPALLHVVSRDARASVDDGPAAIVVTVDEHDARALGALGRERAGTPIVIAIRRTILSEQVLPVDVASSSIRLPIVGGDIAPLYAEFFARGLRTPPVARLTQLSSMPVSPWLEAALVVAVTLLVALGLGLGARRLDAESSPARVITSAALGLLVGALSGWLVSPTADAAFLERLGPDLQLGALEQGLSVAAASVALLGLGRTPRRIEALAIAIGVALGFALDQGAEGLLLLTHGGLVPTSVAAAGRAALACVWGLALSAPREKRFALVTAAAVVAALLEGLALSASHALA